MTTTAAPIPQEPEGSSATPAIVPPEQSSLETPEVGESNATTSEKAKDKEKERERERREDAITIEVCFSTTHIQDGVGRGPVK